MCFLYQVMLIDKYVRRCDIRETMRFDTLTDRIFLVQLSNFVKKKKKEKTYNLE